MAQAVAQVGESQTRAGVKVAVVVWILTALFYFYQYAMRSAPAVMMPDLSEAFGVSAVGVASIALRRSGRGFVDAVSEGDRTSGSGETRCSRQLEQENTNDC